MKRLIILFVLCILLCGCGHKIKEETRTYIYSSSESFEYDNCRVIVTKIKNDCVLNQNCKESDDIKIKVKAGNQYFTSPYTINNKKITDIKSTDCHLKVEVDEYGTAIVLYK